METLEGISYDWNTHQNGNNSLQNGLLESSFVMGAPSSIDDAPCNSNTAAISGQTHQVFPLTPLLFQSKGGTVAKGNCADREFNSRVACTCCAGPFCLEDTASFGHLSSVSATCSSATSSRISNLSTSMSSMISSDSDMVLSSSDSEFSCTKESVTDMNSSNVFDGNMQTDESPQLSAFADLARRDLSSIIPNNTPMFPGSSSAHESALEMSHHGTSNEISDRLNYFRGSIDPHYKNYPTIEMVGMMVDQTGNMDAMAKSTDCPVPDNGDEMDMYLLPSPLDSGSLSTDAACDAVAPDDPKITKSQTTCALDAAKTDVVGFQKHSPRTSSGAFLRNVDYKADLHRIADAASAKRINAERSGAVLDVSNLVSTGCCDTVLPHGMQCTEAQQENIFSSTSCAIGEGPTEVCLPLDVFDDVTAYTDPFCVDLIETELWRNKLLLEDVVSYCEDLSPERKM